MTLPLSTSQNRGIRLAAVVLPPPEGSHQGHHFTGPDRKTHILQRGPVRAGVGEGHMVKGHGGIDRPLLHLRLLHGLLAQDLIRRPMASSASITASLIYMMRLII